MLDGMLNVYADPPHSPEECIFAQTTECFSSDLERRITPCQFGGNPDCSNCGCIASAGLEAIGRHRLTGGLPVGKIFYASLNVGERWSDRRDRSAAACARSTGRSAKRTGRPGVSHRPPQREHGDAPPPRRRMRPRTRRPGAKIV